METDKENAPRRSYAALQLQRKHATSAGKSVPLPRVAALAAGGSTHGMRREDRSTQPRSSLRSSGYQPLAKPPGASAPRMGFKPATHSTRTLVPLLDTPATSRPAPAPVLEPTPLSPSSMAPTLIPAVSPVAASPLTITIGDPTLDDAEAALQAELALTDRRLEALQSQQLHRRSVTPDHMAEDADPALSVGTLTPQAAPQQQPPDQAVPAPSPQLPSQAVQESRPAASPTAQVPPPVPPEQQSIVRSVTSATGTGCKDVIAAHAAAALAHGACWTTRGHRVLHLESSCILQLWSRRTSDITLRITFADAASVPRLVRLEHAPSPTAAFERLGDIMLQAKSLKQLRHLFRLGQSLEVQRFMRITLVGHMAETHSGAHRVSHMLLTSGNGPQPTQSAMSQAADISASMTSGSVQASANTVPEVPTADSAASGTPAPAPAWPAEPGGSGSATGMPAPAMVEGVLAPAVSDACSPASAVGGTLAAAAAPAASVPPQKLCTGTASQATISTSGSSGSEGENQRSPSPAPESSAQVQANSQAEGSVWGTLEDAAEAQVDFALLAAEFGAGSSGGKQHAEPSSQEPQHLQPVSEIQDARQQASSGVASPPMMLLQMQRCREVEAAISQLGLDPQQAKAALEQLLDTPASDTAALPLADDQLDILVGCLPSPEEHSVLAGFGGTINQLGAAEQLMVQLMQVPAVLERLEARRLAAAAMPHIKAAAAAAHALESACTEVAQSEVLRTLLKVAMLAANFLNAGNQNGAASGFQIDALQKLKDVRSSRARSRTLLHFVAREVARQHPEGACLKAALPSVPAAAQVDVPAIKTGLQELTADVRRTEKTLAAALEGSPNAPAAAQLASFRTEVVEQLANAVAALDAAAAAFRHLGTFINAQRETLASPAAFFGMLNRFAEELEAAHQENADADAAASGKDGKPRRASEGASPASSQITEADAVLRQRTNSSGSSMQEDHRQGRQPPPAEKGAAALERLKLASLERLSAAGIADSSKQVAGPRKQHSPQPSASVAAGGKTRSRQNVHSSSGSPPPAVSSVNAAALLAQASAAGAEPLCGVSAKLSTPVANLLAESARLIHSVDLTGSVGGVMASAAAANSADGPQAGVESVPATPDGDVCSADVGAEDWAGYATPRSAVSMPWLVPQEQRQPNMAGQQHWAKAQQQREQQQAVQAAAACRVQGQARYTATTSSEVEAPPAVPSRAAAVGPADCLASSLAGSLAQRGSQGLALSQLRQRCLPQLSPTSTPLSSLGRQSSRCSSDAGSTPRDSLRARGSQLQRSASPLGLGADEPQANVPQPAQQRSANSPGIEHGNCVAAPAVAAAGVDGNSGEVQAPEGVALPARELCALHSRASSCDLTYYAPFHMDRQGPAAFAADARAPSHGPSASFSYSQSQDAACAWGPLAAEQQRRRPSTIHARHVRHTSADEGLLSEAAAAAAGVRAHVPTRAAVSVPCSPRQCAPPLPSAGRRPLPLNLHGLTDRLQVQALGVSAAEAWQQNEQRQGVSSGAPAHVARYQQHSPPLSPVLEALLAHVPSPDKPAQAELAADDLADLAGFSSDHETEWQQLERIEQQAAEWQRQQLAQQETRELLLMQQALLCGQQGQLTACGDGNAGTQSALVPLPSPINSSTSNLDAAVARLLASAGNTPTGPLGLGMRAADAWAGHVEQARAAPPATDAGRQVALLEPLVPAPLGEGVRASHTLARNVPAAALRLSVEGPRAMLLQPQGTAAAGPSRWSTLAEEMAEWAAADGGGYAEGEMLLPGNSYMPGRSDAEGGAGAGPVRRQRPGLRRYLP